MTVTFQIHALTPERNGGVDITWSSDGISSTLKRAAKDYPCFDVNNGSVSTVTWTSNLAGKNSGTIPPGHQLGAGQTCNNSQGVAAQDGAMYTFTSTSTGKSITLTMTGSGSWE